jgi:hypothetical protein
VAVVAVVGLVLAVALIVSRQPRPVTGTATLDECLWGWPVVILDGEDWRAAVPDDLGPNAPRQIPVVRWPPGMRYDEAADVLLDERGDAAFRRGDRVRISGTMVRTGGDPAPCFYTVGVEIERIAGR